jgi:predicted ATPase/DNA-binding SARP family transcriptional activator
MASLSLALLGALRVSRDGKPVSGFESARVRALLAYLAVEADRPHQRDALAALLWPEQPDQAARSNLRQALANLRLALGDRAAAPPFLLVSRDTIQFNRASDHTLDSADFLALLAACQAHPHRRLEACASCAARLERAAALYVGHFLEGFFISDSVPFDEWATLRREDLHQRASAALATLTAYHERRGSYEAARRYAQRQLELDPWREEAHRQLMRVLLLSGERSAALAQYEACRRVLDEELGVEPDAETTALYEQIRSSQAQTAREEARAPLSACADPTLPLQPTSFVGREAELAELADMLESAACRMITIVGAGGVGKTRLALEVASRQTHAFADGVVFVALAGLSSADFLLSALADALGITLRAQGDPKAQLLEQLRGKELLLVLDNFEHLLEATTLLAELLRGAPGLTLLVTSRERLDLQWEWVFDIAGLSYPPEQEAARLETFSAVQLFKQRARQVRRHFALAGDEGQAVARICRLFEGIPLGIELAAAAVREQSCAEIAERIGSSITHLATSARDVPARHRSMRAVFDHSWQLLSLEERRAFRQASVFRGGFTAEAATVAGGSPEALATLTAKSLLRRLPSDRYDMHEAVRQYAEWQLREAGELEQTRDRHLLYMLALAEAAEPELVGPEQKSWLNRLDAEHDNMRAALQWALAGAEPQPVLRLSGALMRFWAVRGHLSEGRRWMEQILAHRGYSAAPVPLRLKGLNAAGMLTRLQGDYAQSKALLEGCLELARENGETRWVAIALNALGLVARRQGDPDKAARLYEESLVLARQVGDRLGTVNALANLAGVVNAQGDRERARGLYEESLAYSREAGDRLGIAADLNNLANVVFDLGDYGRARGLYEESHALYREGGDQYGQSLTLFNLGDLAIRTGDHERARANLTEGLALSQVLGDNARCAEYLERLALLAANQRDPVRAARLWGAAAALREALGAAHSPHEIADHEREVQVARAQLDEATFAAAWEAGRALSLEQAVAEALGV